MSPNFLIALLVISAENSIFKDGYHIYNFDEEINIVSIELLSLQIPNSLYNIRNHNNKFAWTRNIDCDFNVIDIPNGLYSIEDLLKYLSEKMGSDYQISFDKITRRIKIESRRSPIVLNLDIENS